MFTLIQTFKPVSGTLAEVRPLTPLLRHYKSFCLDLAPNTRYVICKQIHEEAGHFILYTFGIPAIQQLLRIIEIFHLKEIFDRFQGSTLVRMQIFVENHFESISWQPCLKFTQDLPVFGIIPDMRLIDEFFEIVRRPCIQLL